MEATNYKKVFTVTFLGRDERGFIVKGIDILAESSEHAIELVKEISRVHVIYSAIESLQLISQPEQEQNDIQLFMDDIHKWADDTFGTERTSIAPLHHLQKEVEETIKAMKQGIRENTLIELADCFILILNASSKYRVTFAELLKVSRNKMEINKSRKWGKPDSNGVCEHIREVHPSTEQSVEITEMFDEIESIVWFENKSQRLKFDAIKAKWLRDKIKSKDTITTKDLNEIDKAREEKLTLEDQIREMLKKMKISSLW